MSFPASPVLNEVFIANGKAWKFDGTNWVIPQKASTLPWELVTGKPTYFPADWSSTLANIPDYFNAKVISSEFPPTNQVTGTLWWDETNKRLYVYQSNVWVETAAALREKFITIDPDVINYVTAVETADGAPLEQEVVTAFEAFIIECKIAGIWDKIGTGCILAGARTLAGAMVPIKGSFIPTLSQTGFDYVRKTGFGGSTFSINTNYPNLTNAISNRHLSAYITEPDTTYSVYDPAAAVTINGNTHRAIIAAGTTWSYGGTLLSLLTQKGTYAGHVAQQETTLFSTQQPYNVGGLVAAARSNSANFQVRANGVTETFVSGARTQSMPGNSYIIRPDGVHSFGRSNARISFYSMGESLDLSILDARVTKLMTTLSTVIL